ncbi:cellulose biosynthesis regulator diguanylate cyclase DgcQ [uncultured Pluralibacter sp.]|uniref:cellulose biosynthesis regulator diguanylate cyclase DgcQ n=1 Tax=uncultured Pluralibacter sp. TaxID=1490864 RepID=UPI0026293533|nr:cellulose biosynthesis regulator diguanylate cyclase DgcQ [uncultured Pluralibacter sp.]
MLTARANNPLAVNGIKNPGRVVNVCFFTVILFATLLTWREIVVLEDSWVASQRNSIADVAHQLDGELQMATGQLFFYRSGMQSALENPLGWSVLQQAREAYQSKRAEDSWSVYLNNQRTLKVFGISDARVAATPLLSRDTPKQDDELYAALEGGYLLRLASAYNSAPYQFYYVSRAGYYLTSDTDASADDTVAAFSALIAKPWFVNQTGRRNPARGIRWSMVNGEASNQDGRQIVASLPLDFERYWYGVLSMIFTPAQMRELLERAIQGEKASDFRLYDSSLTPIAFMNESRSADGFSPVEKAQLSRAFEEDTRGGLRFDTRYVSWQKLRCFDGVVLRVNYLSEGVRSDFGEMSIALGLLWLLFTSLLLLSWAVIRRMVHNMSALQASLQWQAWYDGLTALYNRNSLFDAAAKVAAACEARGEPLAVIQLDLDHFKRINDTYGHQAGDKVLSQTAAMMAEKIREGDLIGRVGGEEFCIILPDTSLEEACAVAERIRGRIYRREILLSCGQSVRISASLGISASDENDSYDIEHLQSVADKRLYLAKQQGRNRVCCRDGIGESC